LLKIEMAVLLRPIVARMRAMSNPVIAMINGHAHAPDSTCRWAAIRE